MAPHCDERHHQGSLTYSRCGLEVATPHLRMMQRKIDKSNVSGLLSVAQALLGISKPLGASLDNSSTRGHVQDQRPRQQHMLSQGRQVPIITTQNEKEMGESLIAQRDNFQF